jgi:hypothetical protein
MRTDVKYAIAGTIIGSLQGFAYQKNFAAAGLGAIEGAVIFVGQQMIVEKSNQVIKVLVDGAIEAGRKRQGLHGTLKHYFGWGIFGAANGLLTALTQKTALSALPAIMVSAFGREGAWGAIYGAITGFAGIKLKFF